MSKQIYESFFRSAACALLIAVAVPAFAGDKPKFDINKPLGDAYAANSLVGNDQSRLVIYRASRDASLGVVTIYLAGKYHVSLQPNAFSVVCLEADQLEVRTRLTAPDAEIDPDLDTRTTLKLKNNQTQFLRITSQSNGKATLDEVLSRRAIQELIDVKQQMHVQSRASVVRQCKKSQLAKKEVDAYDITFGAQAPFQYKKTDFASITAQGKAALNEVVDKINSKYSHAVKVKVQVLGFADEGQLEADNQKISLARADAVRDYFLHSGLSAEELAIEGLGSNVDPKGLTLGTPKRAVQIEVTVTMR